MPAIHSEDLPSESLPKAPKVSVRQLRLAQHRLTLAAKLREQAEVGVIEPETNHSDEFGKIWQEQYPDLTHGLSSTAFRTVKLVLIPNTGEEPASIHNGLAG